MQKKHFRHSEILYILLFWLTVLLIISLGFYLNEQSKPLPMFQGTVSYKEPDWKFGEKGKNLVSTHLWDRHVMEPGKVYVLTTNLSYNGQNDPYPSALITTGNLEVEVYFRGDSVFRNSVREKVFRKVRSVGSSCFSVSLGKDCAGKNFRVELRNPMDHAVNRRLPGITFGDYEAQIRNVFLKCVPSMLLGSAIVFAVMILILLGNTVDGTQWTYLYFAVFALFIVLYRAMQNVFILYLWGNPFMSVLCEYFSVVACPIPLLTSCRYRLKPYGQKVFRVLIGLSFLNLLMQSVLHFTGIRDVTDMVFVTHVWLLLVSVSIVIIGFRAERDPKTGRVLSKLLPIVVGTILDLLHFYYHKYVSFLGEFYSMGNFVGIGLLISLFLMIWEARRARIDAARELERNQVLQKMAYTDSLTGIKNRTAFTKAMADVSTGKVSRENIMVVSADLNGLKQTNDRLGHSAGDRLIRRAAKALEDGLGPYGEVFRTGGDEFFAVLMDVDEAKWKTVREELYKIIREMNETDNMFLSIAIGEAVLENGNINKAIQLSDQRMYADKERQHKIMKDI